MTPMVRQALEYVKNAGGNATDAAFFEDHAPVGPNLWQGLRFPTALIEHSKEPGRDRFLVLTAAGRAALGI